MVMARRMSEFREQVVHPVDVRIGASIRERRQVRGLSPGELGSRIGVSARQIELYEQGIDVVSASELAGIARELCVEPGWFFEGSATAPAPLSDERRVADAFARIDKPAVRASVVRLLEAMALQSATWVPNASPAPDTGRH